jgi:GNAT superfamily N-acetyltransferase
MKDIFPIRRATVDDVATIIGMIDEAAAWLATKDTDQWAKPWPSKTARDARVRRGILSLDTWIAEDHGKPMATITYRKFGNQNLWTPAELRDSAVYACRLIVRRRWAGDGIGAALIDWAGYRALQTWRAQWIRIDVWTGNLPLQAYYEKLGFAPVRICPDDESGSSPSGALFQKPTAEVNEVAATRFTQAIGMPLARDQTSRLPVAQGALSTPAVSVSKAPARHGPVPTT